MQIIQHSFRIILGISVVLISTLSMQEIEVQSSVNFSDKLLHFLCFLYFYLYQIVRIFLLGHLS